jgi:hypothetical protein
MNSSKSLETPSITRAGFLALAGTLAGAAAMQGRLARAATPAVDEIEWDYETDVLILGSGSGASGAIVDCLESDSDVIIVEKNDWLGGTMRRSGGGIGAAETCVQKALGVDDSKDDFYDYLVACGEGYVDEEMLRVFVDRAASDFDWVVQNLAGQTEKDWAFTNGTDGMEIAMRPGLDISGTPVYYEELGFEAVPRCYWFSENPDDIDPDGSRLYCSEGVLGRPETDKGRGGTGLWKVFQDVIDAHPETTILYKTSLQKLISNGNEVVGAQCIDLGSGEPVFIKARQGVILATGTWAGSEYLVDTYLLGADQSGLYPWVLESMAGGEGVIAAQALGAATVTMAAGPRKGGIKTDTNAQVLDVYGDPIPRLYASSYVVGGKVYQKYPCCGMHNFLNCVFGRVAAENVLKLDKMA